MAGLAIIGVGIGSTLLVTLLSFSAGIDKIFSDTFTKIAGDVVVAASDAPLGGGILGGGTPLPTNFVKRIEKLDHVIALSETVTATIPKQSIKVPNPFGAILVGVNPEKDKTIDGPTANIKEGRLFTTNREIILGRHMQNDAKLAGSKINIGDKIKIPKGKPKITPQFGPSGMPLQPKVEQKYITVELVGIFETGSIISDSNFYGPIALSREIAKISSKKVSNIRVRADDSQNVELLATAIKKEFEKSDPEIEVTISKDILGDLNQSFGILKKFLYAIAAIAFAAGGMSILIIMLMSILERLVEFGILKATGWSNRDIIFSVLIEGITMATTGVLVGLGMGYTLIMIVNRYVQEFGIVTPQIILESVAVGIITGVIGGLYPAFKASRVSPIETLRGM